MPYKSQKHSKTSLVYIVHKAENGDLGIIFQWSLGPIQKAIEAETFSLINGGATEGICSSRSSCSEIGSESAKTGWAWSNG